MINKYKLKTTKKYVITEFERSILKDYNYYASISYNDIPILKRKY